MPTKTRERIVVVGSGFAGLSVAAALANSGWPVIVLEAAATLGGKASTRNQGWLHSGAVFALDNHAALARECYQSLQRTVHFCPAAVEPGCEGMLYLATRPESETRRWQQAWEEAGIPFAHVAREDALAQLPGFNPDLLHQAFQLPDLAFRPDILLEALAASVRNAGSEILLKTQVTGFIRSGDSVQGVHTADGQEFCGVRTILATGAAAPVDWSELFPCGPGTQPVYRAAALKAHLVSTRPEVCRRSFCVPDRQGFNHLPHRETSIFGSTHWPSTHQPHDVTVERKQADMLWSHVRELFPDFDAESGREIHEWAGTTIEVLHVDQVEPAIAPQPTVINHRLDSPGCANVWSVYPGRATLWGALAETAREQILTDIGSRPPAEAARTPWDVTDRE